MPRILPRSTPEAEGVSPAALLAFFRALDELDSVHSLMIMRHGRVIAEAWKKPYAPELPHMLFSLSKSFTSSAVGFACAEGKLSLDARLIDLFPDKLPEHLDEKFERMRIRHLLAMDSGHNHCTMDDMAPAADWEKAFFAAAPAFEPGTHFCYNSGATYMLASAVVRATGMGLRDYLRPRLFDPLGIAYHDWELSPAGIEVGGWGFNLTTEEIASFAQCLLDHGMRDGKQILPPDYLDQAVSVQSDNSSNDQPDWKVGYGFQFWRCRHNAFRGDGAFGQYCLVLPEQDAVLAINSGLGDMQQVLNEVWTNLLPGIRSSALPADASAQARLAGKLSKLALRTVAGARSSEAAQQILGKTFTFDDNEKGLQALTLSSDAKGFSLAIRNAHGEQRLDCGMDQWTPGQLTFEKNLTTPIDTTNGKQPVAASGAWLAPDLYQAVVYFRETPYRLTLTLRFKDDRLYLDLDYNVMFGPKKKWSLIGRP